MSFNSPLCKDATKQGPFTKDTIANRDAIQRSCFPTFDILNESRYRFDIELKDKGVNENGHSFFGYKVQVCSETLRGIR